jgi:hypothetical protein
MASQFTHAYVTPQQQRPQVFCCQLMALANQVPTFESSSPAPHRQIDDRYDVERLAVQHVPIIPINNSHRDQLLQDIDCIIQVQKLLIQGNSPRYFAVVQSLGVLKIERWVEVSITEATLII